MPPASTCVAPPRRTVAKGSEALQLRKTMKPLMEKRRRARINGSLDRLKRLILPLTGRDKTRCSKLEKADILELTVRFLSDTPPVGPQDSRYREGYTACLQRVSALLPRNSLDQDACRRVSDFVQQSASAAAAAVTPTCPNCCAQSSRTFPQIQQRPPSLQSSFGSRSESRSRSGPQAMWRPW